MAMLVHNETGVILEAIDQSGDNFEVIHPTTGKRIHAPTNKFTLIKGDLMSLPEAYVPKCRISFKDSKGTFYTVGLMQRENEDVQSGSRVIVVDPRTHHVFIIVESELRKLKKPTTREEFFEQLSKMERLCLLNKAYRGFAYRVKGGEWKGPDELS